MRYCLSIFSLILLTLLISAGSVSAQLTLSPVFKDHMVLQRDQPWTVSGTAAPGSSIVTVFIGIERTALANKKGRWQVDYPPLPASALPASLTINCSRDSIRLNNILVGDVWLCIGQSNMEWPMFREMHYEEELPHTSQPLIRLLNPTYAGKNIFGTAFSDSVLYRLQTGPFFDGAWQTCTPSTIKTMSAVAYYFGKNIAEKIAVPIGLIHLGIGGAPLETFIDRKALQRNSQFAAKVQGNWLYNQQLPLWTRERGLQNLEILPDKNTGNMGPDHAYKPGLAYEKGVAPLMQLPVKGILCYQGESNAQEEERVNEYAALTKLMVEDYRRKWKQPNLPFYFVQLSSIDTIKYKGQMWPAFRDEQRKILDILPNSGMAVCSDIGHPTNVHPANKKDVGYRLAQWALANLYGYPVTPFGPLPASARYANGKVSVQFNHVGEGLTTADGLAVKGFSLDGVRPAEASLTPATVEIPTPSKPAFIYYGWAPFSEGNLINTAKLPASTFRIPVQ